MVENLKLIVFSFFSSFGFGIVFRIERKNLFWAGLGGALTRLVYILLISAVDQIFIQCLLAAMFASLYAEIMAIHQKMAASVFLYPSILPLVPGSLLYYIAGNLIASNPQETRTYLGELVLSLGGICLGFVLISSFTYYRRIYRMGENLESQVKRWLREQIQKKRH